MHCQDMIERPSKTGWVEEGWVGLGIMAAPILTITKGIMAIPTYYPEILYSRVSICKSMPQCQ